MIWNTMYPSFSMGQLSSMINMHFLHMNCRIHDFFRRFECFVILFRKSYIETTLFEHGFMMELYILLFAAEVGEPRWIVCWLTKRSCCITYAFVWMYFFISIEKRGRIKRKKNSIREEVWFCLINTINKKEKEIYDHWVKFRREAEMEFIITINMIISFLAFRCFIDCTN